MNNSTVKSIKKFFHKEQSWRGNVFFGEAMTTAKSFAKGAVLAVMGGMFTVERIYNNELKLIIRNNYIERLRKGTVREISISEMRDYLILETERINKNEKSFWKSANVFEIKTHQRAECYYQALKCLEEYSELEINKIVYGE